MNVLVGHVPLRGRREAAALIAESRDRQRRRRVRLAVVVMVAIGGGATSYGISQAIRTSSSSPSPQCAAAARTVGYAVPCPTRVPRGLVQGNLQAGSSCGAYLVQAAGYGNCARVWRGWVLGSGTAGGADFVIAASPTPLSDVQLVDGPFWVKQTDRVLLLGLRRINGWQMRMVYVPMQANRYGATTNAGSVFANHVVLIWTSGGHSYAVGVRAANDVARAAELATAFARQIVLVTPRR